MERLSARALVGALVAIAGSVLIFFQPGSISFGWGSFALLGLAALFASESVVVSKLAGREHPVAMNFVGMSAGAAVLLIVAGAAGESFALPAEGETQLAIAYLVAATVGLFLLVLVVVQRWSASATSYVFVLMPVVAIALGAVVADEPITVTTLVGGAIVAAGVYIGAARTVRGEHAVNGRYPVGVTRSSCRRGATEAHRTPVSSPTSECERGPMSSEIYSRLY